MSDIIASAEITVTDVKDGVGIEGVVTRFLVTHLDKGVTISTGDWSIDPPSMDVVNKYLWSYETITYTDGHKQDGKPAIIGVYGEDGVGIENIFEYYLVSNISTGILSTDSRFKSTIPTMDETNRYLWKYEEILYTNNERSSTNPVVVGVYGDKGTSIKNIKNYYLATSASSGVSRSTDGFKETMQPLSLTNKYLWNYETIEYENPTSFQSTDPVIIGVHGEDGKDGVDAKLLYLSSTLETMSFDADGAASPASQTATIEAKLQNTSGSISFSARAYNGTSALSDSVALSGSGSSRTFSVSNFPSNATHVSITATLGSLTDTVSIFKLRHGKEGAGGAPGQNAVVGYLTNESITLGANSSGRVGSFAPASGTFKMFDGTTEVTTSESTSYTLENSSGLVASINSSTGVYSITAMSSDTATAEFKAIYKGVSIFKTVTLSKSIAGEKGEPGEEGPRGLTGLQGPEGKQGIQGEEGKDGQSSYTHIAYATGDQGQSFNHDTFPQATYIGMYVSPNQNSSDNWRDYKWTLIKGADGARGLQGPTGDDGRTPYFHTAWANNSTGTSGFSTTVSTDKLYIGTVTTFEEDDPTEPSAYSWTKIKGDKGDRGLQGLQGPEGKQGIQGPEGNDGQSSYTHIAYATGDQGQSFNHDTFSQATYIGMYVSPNQNSSDNWRDYEWTLIKGSRGEQGLPGKEGADGKTPYFHTAWANNSTGTSGFSRTVSSNKLYIGTHTSYDSNPPAAGTYNWVKIKGEKGDTGDSAISAVLTNESITFAADKDGAVQNYVGNTGNFLLMEGAINRSSSTSTTYSIVSQTNVSAKITSNGSYTISSMTGGTSVTAGQVTFRATYKDTTIDKTISISKSIAGQTGGKGDPGAPGGKGDPGAPGAPATSYWLTSSVDTITVKYNGDYDPKTITYYGHSKTGSNNTQNYSGRFIIQTSIDGINFTQAYRSLTNVNKVDFSVPEDVLFIKAKFYQAGGTTYLLDEQTTPILHSADGLKGVGLEDKDYQVGTEIFTDKADDSVVYVEVDGKSYQHLTPNARNMIPTKFEDWENGDYSQSTGAKANTSGRIRVSWLVKVEPNTTYHWNSNYSSAHFVIRSFNSDGVFNSSWGGSGPSGSRTTSDSEHYLGIALYNTTGYEEKFNNGTIKPLFQLASHSDKSFEEFIPQAPTPDRPIEIHSLNDFDVVSSVGKRNLLIGRENGNYRMSSNNSTYSPIIYKSYEDYDSVKLTGGNQLSTYSSEMFTLEKGKEYTASMYVYSPVKLDLGIITYHGDVWTTVPANTWTRLSNTFIGTGERQRFASLFSRTNALNHEIFYNRIKLEEGEISTYSPAPEDIVKNDNHPLIDKINLLLSEPLRSVGDVKDRLFRDNDGLWKVERNIDVMNNITGYDSFNFSASSTGRPDLNRFNANSSLGSVPGYGNAISSHVPTHTNEAFGAVTEESVDVHPGTGQVTLFLNSDRASTTIELRNWMMNNNVEIQYIIEPRTETLNQELQDKLNNLRSFQDSNYIYTIINNKTDIISEKLKPILRSTFKGGGCYARWKSAHDLEKTTDYIEQEIKRTQNTAWIRAGMRVGYSGFTQTNQNSVYICGLEYRDGYRDMVLVDKPAEIYIRESNETAFIPNQSLTVSGIPAGITAYIIWDNTEKSLFLAYFESEMTQTGVSKKRWRNISGQTITFTDSLFAIGEIEV